jgi:hypothetical protein
MVCIREFLIGEIPWIPVRRCETIEPESHRESLQYCHGIVGLESAIVESLHYSESHSLTDIRMIPLGHCDIRKASLLSARWTHSLGSEQDFEYLGSGDSIVRSEPAIAIS